MPAHEWGGLNRIGECIYCGVAPGDLGDCPQHPRAGRAPRARPPSGLEDWEYLKARCDELVKESTAALSGGGEGVS